MVFHSLSDYCDIKKAYLLLIVVRLSSMKNGIRMVSSYNCTIKILDSIERLSEYMIMDEMKYIDFLLLLKWSERTLSRERRC